jgi:hypothetical protein
MRAEILDVQPTTGCTGAILCNMSLCSYLLLGEAPAETVNLP